MTNEIKEILDNLKEVWVSPDGDYMNNELDERETNLLLDYITNLQEKIKNLVLDLDSYKSKYNNIKLHYEELAKENKELQQRIDKAVEYINKYEYQKYCPSPYEKDKYIMREEKEGQDLLDILRGEE